MTDSGGDRDGAEDLAERSRRRNRVSAYEDHPSVLNEGTEKIGPGPILALLVDDARANGFATLTVRALADDISRPTVRGAHVGVRPDRRPRVP